MAFNNQKFAAATGLIFNKANAVFYGTLDSYPVYCKYITGRTTSMIVRLHAKTEDALDFSQYLESWRQKQEGVTQIAFKEREMIVMLQIPARDTVNKLANNVFAIVNMARQSGLQACCMSCGRVDSWSHFVLDGDGCTLCESCRMSTQESMEEVARTKSAEPVNYAGTLLGIVLGAAVLFGVTFLVLKAGYVTYLTGLLGAFLTLVFMKKFGHRISYATAAIGVLVCLVVAVATPAFEFASEIANHCQENKQEAEKYVSSYTELQNLRSDPEVTADELTTLNTLLNQHKSDYDAAKMIVDHQTTWECLKDMSTLLDVSTFSSVRGELIKCILWGVLSIIIGMAVIVPGMLRESYGKHSLVRLS
ncbi:MAG: hypothetical protein IK130_12415 [Oscillospiraceae bacterium]|nr:hypothetical protein [Oscillospiraceae bacterium]